MAVAAFAVGVVAVGLGLASLYCTLNECCNDHWIKNDSRFMDAKFFTHFCGQLAARAIVLKALARHWTNPQPAKPLVLSFHGPSGSGKRLMASLLRDAMFEKKYETNHFHIIPAVEFFPFPKDSSGRKEYQALLKEKIRSAVKGCERAVIVITDVHLLSATLLNAIAPFLDSNVLVDGVSYLRAIFILTSQYGRSGLMQLAEDYRRQGKNIHEIPYLGFEDIAAALLFLPYYKETVFYQSRLVSNHLIDYFVPFFPMDENQIKCCVKRETVRRPTNHQLYTADKPFMERVLENIKFMPENDPWYSEHGCKLVAKAVSLAD